MHIAEGVLSAPVLGLGAGLAGVGLYVGLRYLNQERLVFCGVLSAAFFTASLIHIPVGVASAHLVLNGLVGVLLGWSAFPAIFIALLLQALLFQYGGLTTLGVNTATMGYAAVGAWYAFRGLRAILPTRAGLKIAAFCAGALGVAFSAFLTALALAFTTEGFRVAAGALFLAHVPVMIAEGLLTMLTVEYMVRVRPGLVSFVPINVQQRRNNA